MNTLKYCTVVGIGTALLVLVGCENKSANQSDSNNNPTAGMTNNTSTNLPAPTSP